MICSDNGLVFIYSNDVGIKARSRALHDAMDTYGVERVAEELLATVLEAQELLLDEFVRGLQFEPVTYTFSQARVLAAQARDRRDLKEKTRSAKSRLTAKSRREYSSRRSQLALALIDSGHAYRCAASGCAEHENLTIDHIEPLSRGGSDDLSNLRFLCRGCNSAKGDRRPPVADLVAVETKLGAA